MMNVCLINASSFQKYKEVLKEINPEHLHLLIKKTQNIDLKRFLGHDSYYDFIKNFNADGTIMDKAPQYYKDLYNGSEYLDKSGNIVLYEGLRPTLVYFTLMRIIEAASLNYPSKGQNLRHNSNIDASGDKGVLATIYQVRRLANSHASQVQKFLIDNSPDFTGWNNNEFKVARTIGIVEKTSFSTSRYCNLATTIAIPMYQFMN